MKKISLSIILITHLFISANAQKSKNNTDTQNIISSQGLIVGIVVDQMRNDYIYKFWDKYSEGGFKRLVREGFYFKNTNYNYVPTYTAPGHACIYTGTTPSNNGIISNEWYDKFQKKTIYCVGDSTVKPLGTTSISGKMSPRNLITTTVTDELKLASNFHSKVIGIALKDRGAILPAGHKPNGAYWHDPFSNNMVTSNYYMDALPDWVTKFNDRKIADSLTNIPWTTLLPIADYTESGPDDNSYEGLFTGETKPVFPHNLPELKKTESELIREVPGGNDLTKEFAKAAIAGEQLGKGNYTDFLAISFSSTDYVGHMYGINAVELEDVYLRLDKDIEDLLKYLDQWTGNNYTLFLTADHGAENNVDYSKDNHITADKFSSGNLSDPLKKYIKDLYGVDSMIVSASTHNIHLNRSLIESKKLRLEDVQNKCAEFVSNLTGVSAVMTASEMNKGIKRYGIYSFMQNGYNQQRSGDVSIQLQSGWMDWYSKTGTTHGSSYTYDTHVPLIFFGKKIKQGATLDPVTVTDIAPTISGLLNIEFPSGNTGQVLNNYLK